MTELPIGVKVLKYLVNTTVPTGYNDIIRMVDEGQVLVNRALTELTARGLVDRYGEDCYQYHATAEADELCQKLFVLYDRVIARVQKESLVRGLLSQPSPCYLWRTDKLLEVLGKEGFTREDTMAFLDEEEGKDYIKRIRLIFVARVPFVAPSFIPYYNISDIRNVDADEYEQLKQQCQNLGLSMNEEHYLLGTYPPELSLPAIHSLEEEKRQVRDMLVEEASRQWQGLTYSWEGFKGHF